MTQKKTALKLLVVILFALIIGFLDMPSSWQAKIFEKGIPNFISNIKVSADKEGNPITLKEGVLSQKINLGLDLQGGTQLDYKIDMSKVAVKDRESIIDGVKGVITKRVDSLGVAEPNIYSSKIGDEYHIVVELAGIKDINEAKQKVGKTIQLEFKEEKATIDPEEKTKINQKAEETLKKILASKDKFKFISEEEQQGNPGKVFYSVPTEGYFKNDAFSPFKLPTELFTLENETIYPKLIEVTEKDNEYSAEGKKMTGYSIYKLVTKEEAEKSIEEPREVSASHILIAYQGADRADTSVTRTEEEARKLAEEIQGKIAKGDTFAELAKQYSDDQGSKTTSGVLPDPVVDGKEGYVAEFSKAALGLIKVDEISPTIKSAFGFHIIKADKIKEKISEKKKEPKIKVERLFFSTLPDPWQDTALNGEHFKHADVQFDQSSFNPYVAISFDEIGGKMFQELTKKNIGKRLAIFVGGGIEPISAPTVQGEIAGGQAIITGNFSLDEANELARDLNTGAIPAPILLSGQTTIGATLGADALQKSLKAGAIGLVILAVGMMLYYGFAGFLAVAALSIYALIVLFFIKVQFPYTYSLLISIIIFIAIISKILKSKDPAGEKFISFVLACFILFFMSFLLSTPIVQSLAGIAGTILSIGMAVDANVLIFERIREELKAGKPLNQAVELGFGRAWSSIRDSNFSTLITCGILLYFGSSVVKGFAFNLATGVLVSMFTAITITKTFVQLCIPYGFSKNYKFFVGLFNKNPIKELPFIKNYKKYLAFSSLMIVAGLIVVSIFGVRLGMDFKGGALFEFKFEKNITVDELQKSLKEIQSNIDFGGITIVETAEKTFQVKMLSIDEPTHNIIIQNLENKLGKFEELRFITVGATIGATLKKQALTAVIVAMLMMIVYIAFAFRNIPKNVSPWRFGVTAIIALFHDIAICTLFYMSLSLFGAELDLLYITAILTVIGYSINDTIIIFDRIRENLKFQKRGDSLENITNKSLSETIARSINTTVSTLITIIALAIFGAASIKFFVIALILGISLGAYSSIFIASPLLVLWSKWVVKKEK